MDQFMDRFERFVTNVSRKNVEVYTGTQITIKRACD